MRFFLHLATILSLGGLVVGMSGEATASGIGCDNRQHTKEIADPNAISRDIKFPYGYLCHMVHTRGKEVTEQQAAYTTNAGIYAPLVKDVCNWRIDFVYYDTKGNEYLKDKGETVSDCKQGASRTAEARTLPDYGSTCAMLIVDGEVRLSQCHGLNE